MTEPTGGGRDGARPTDTRRFATTRRDFVRVAGAGAAAASVGLGVTGTASAEGIPTPWLQRDGNLLRDDEGSPVTLRGVNVADPARLNETTRRYHVTAPEVVEMALDESAGWYNRIVRIPCQSGDIAGADVNEVDPGEFSQSDLVDYLENDLRPVVDLCGEEGAYCIVDYHRHDDANLEYTDDALDAEVELFWETIAPEFADDPHVLYEVYNEPIAPYPGHQDPTSGVDVMDPEAEDTWLTWRDAAQPWVNTIREHAPENVIIVGSPRWTQWTYWADEHEFDGENLAYAGHVYAHENLRPLDEYFGKPAENVPVFMTEFGYDDETPEFLKGTTSEEGEEFVEFFEAFPHVHWQVWCFDPFWQPAMFEEDSNGDWILLGGEDYHGEFFKQYLAEKRDDRVPGSGGAPAPPSSVEVVELEETTATLEWSEASAADSYAVYLDGDEVETTAARSTTVDGLDPSTAYVAGVATVTVDGTESRTRTVEFQTQGGEDLCAQYGGESATVDTRTVCDLDGDGLHRDVNADGEVGQDDVVHFFENQHRSAWKEPELFDFSGSDTVGHGDVIALFEYVAT